VTTVATHPRAGVILDVLLEDYGNGSQGEVHTIEVVPRSVTIERNDHRTADTFEATLINTVGLEVA